MKNKLLLIIVFCISQSFFSQEKEKKNTFKFNKDAFLKELAENACECIDSIDTFNKIKDTIASEINVCIDKQVTVYQFGLQMADIEIDLETLTDSTQIKQKDANIIIASNPDSEQYKEAYYDLERYLVDNCIALKSKISVYDKLNEKSLSNNPLASEYYNKGLDAFDAEDYNKAITFYKKAVTVDPDFAFAYDNMGVCYRKLNQFDDAIKLMKNH